MNQHGGFVLGLLIIIFDLEGKDMEQKLKLAESSRISNRIKLKKGIVMKNWPLTQGYIKVVKRIKQETELDCIEGLKKYHF